MGLFSNNDSKPPEGSNTPPAGNSKPPEGNTAPPAGNDKPPEGDGRPPEGPPEVYRWRCTEACTFQKRYRKPGDVIELSEKLETIPCFEKVI